MIICIFHALFKKHDFELKKKYNASDSELKKHNALDFAFKTLQRVRFQINDPIDEQHTSNTILNPYNLWDMVPAALMSLNHTNDRDSMSHQYPQPTTHQPRTDSYPVFSSLRAMDSKWRGLRVSFAFFQRNYLPDGRMNETVAKVEELSDLWKPGAMDGIPPFVMSSNCI